MLQCFVGLHSLVRKRQKKWEQTKAQKEVREKASQKLPEIGEGKRKRIEQRVETGVRAETQN